MSQEQTLPAESLLHDTVEPAPFTGVMSPQGQAPAFPPVLGPFHSRWLLRPDERTMPASETGYSLEITDLSVFGSIVRPSMSLMKTRSSLSAVSVS